MMQRLKKIFHWTEWPWGIVYFPVYFYCAWLGIKSRSASFFTVVNPSIYMSGLFGYSKMKFYSLLPQELLPKTFFLKRGERENIAPILSFFGNTFPLIVKPDIGERGLGISFVSNETELLDAITNAIHFPLLVQEFLPHKKEAGILFKKLPNSDAGSIDSITGKIFLSVIGDGKSSLFELIEKKDMEEKRKKEMVKKNEKNLKRVIKKGEKYILEIIGNHCRGTAFTDCSRKITKPMNEHFQNIAKTIPGFHFGRFDVKFNTWEGLERGEMKIIELNGINSEPVFLYSKGTSLFKAQKILMKNWKSIYEIAKKQLEKGLKPVPPRIVLRDLYYFLQYQKTGFFHTNKKQS